MGHYRVKVVREFAAAHSIRNYPGNCERLHGHNWRVEVTVSSSALNAIGISFDFRELRRLLDRIVDPLDHQNLNELPMFAQQNPSTENVARYLSDQLTLVLPAEVLLEELWVWESSRSAAAYCRQS